MERRPKAAGRVWKDRIVLARIKAVADAPVSGAD
jgi:hypothetical protein